MPLSLRKHLERINRAETDLVSVRPGVTGQRRGSGAGVGRARHAGLKAFRVEATAGRRQALARLGQRPTAEGRAGAGGAGPGPRTDRKSVV